MRRTWTIEEEKRLEYLVSNGNLSFKQIGQLMFRSASSCQTHSRRELGLRAKYIHRRYSVNENFWSETNAKTMYWGGFCAADASLLKSRNQNTYTFALEIAKKDIGHLQEFRKDTMFSGPIKEYKRKNDTVKIRVNSQKWFNDLGINFGITPRKTNIIMPPKVEDKKLLTQWLIGYTDGDGCVSLGCRNTIPYISYSSCNQELMRWIKTYFDAFGTQLKSKQTSIRNHSGYSTFKFGGLKAAQFINMVNTMNIYCLYRKWKNPAILTIVANYKQKYPHLFSTNLL